MDCRWTADGRHSDIGQTVWLFFFNGDSVRYDAQKTFPRGPITGAQISVLSESAGAVPGMLGLLLVSTVVDPVYASTVVKAKAAAWRVEIGEMSMLCRTYFLHEKVPHFE